MGENLIQHARLFDYGSASYCRPHFQNVDSTTKYSKDTGYGWENPNQVLFEWTNNMVTQCSTGRQPHDELLRDNVYQINTPFLVDLPDGVWRVHLLEGAMLGWYSLHPSFYDLKIVANDKPVLIRRAAGLRRARSAATMAWIRPISSLAKTSSGSTWRRIVRRWSSTWRSKAGS